jgi:hypothetical protein
MGAVITALTPALGPVGATAAVGAGTYFAAKEITKAVKPPKPTVVEPPEALKEGPPATVDEQVGDVERKRLLRKRGRKATFLTGDLVPEFTGKKTLLG